MMIKRIVIVMILVHCITSIANAQAVFTNTGFSAAVYATGTPVNILTDLTLGPDGTDLFIVGNEDDSVYRVDTDGRVNTWVTGIDGPWGIAFAASPTLGTCAYVSSEDAPDGIYRVDLTTQSVSAQLSYIDEGTAVAVSSGGLFGDYLYATQAVGPPTTGHVYRVGGDMQPTVFATLGDVGTSDMMLTSGGTFGEYLYVIGRLDGSTPEKYLRRIDSAGNVSLFSDQDFENAWCSLAESPGGVWGDFIYVGNRNGNIYRVDSLGQAATFATGFAKIGGLAFSADGQTLYVAQSEHSDVIVAVVPEPATMSLLALGGVAMLKRKR
jgi:hypothetical protein